MSDVGTSAGIVEVNLTRVFELATKWRAILLFDEADIFLETRSVNDLLRNTLVSVLLRLLEYFQGILFLTSNRVKTFDEAFQSRVNLAVHFKELSTAQRKKVWRLWIERLGSENIGDEEKFKEELQEGGELEKAELNGRQIRNVFRSALAMARARGIGKQKLMYSDVEGVLKRTVEFQLYMAQTRQLAEKQGLR